MLERECHNIPNSLNRNGTRVPRKAFADDYLDPANVVSWVPKVLVEKFAPKRGKPEPLKLAGLRKLYP
jgi:hypothetical protein